MSQIFLEIVSYNLKAVGYTVFTAENGVDGVKKAKKKKTAFNYSRCYDARNGWY